MERLPEGWTSHQAPTGHTYYYHAATKKSTYKKPISEIQEAITTASVTGDDADLTLATDRLANSQNNTSQATPSYKQVNTQNVSRKPHDRPKKKFDIPHAEPWVQVTTKFGHLFYHNTTTLESSWNIPENVKQAVELHERSDDPKALRSMETYESDDIISHVQDEHSDDDEELYEEQVVPEVTEYDEDDIARQLAAMQENGESALISDEDDGPSYTLQEKSDIFQHMLEDCNIDPFRPWDTQVSNIASDPRYLVFDTTHQRKLVFEEYCTRRAKELQEEKALQVREDPKVVYLRFLRQYAKKGQYFVEFKRKYKKEAAYRMYGNSDNEREKLFRMFQELNKLGIAEQEANFMDLVAGRHADPELDVRYHMIDPQRAAQLLQDKRSHKQ